MLVTSAVNCAVVEGRIHAVDGFTVIVGPCVPEVPFPWSGITSGLPFALSNIVKFAAYEVNACGSKET
jgi:hypothetical protein